MNTYLSASWSDPCSSSSEEENDIDSLNRNTHHNRTKRIEEGRQEQQQWGKEEWTWEEILDGKGPWTQPGEYRRPKAELEAAKAERRFYEAKARKSGWKPERLTQKFLGGWLKGSVAKPGWIPEPTPRACRGVRGRRTGQTPCYAVKRTVSPVRVLSPVRAIPPCRTGRARLGIEPDAMKPAQRIWPPVRLLGPAYMAPALQVVSPVRLHSPVRAIPPRRTGRATGTIQPGKVGEARCSRARVLLHGPVYPAPPSHPSPVPSVPTPRTRLPVHLQSPVPPPRTLPMVRVSSPVPPVPVPRTRPIVRLSRPESAVCPAVPERPVCPAVPELPVCPAVPELPVCPAVPELPVCPAPSVSPAPSEPSVSPAPSEPSVCPEPLEPVVSQDLPGPPTRQDLPEPPTRQDLPELPTRQDLREPSASHERPEPSSQDQPEPSSQDQPEPSSQDLPEPSASQDPPEPSASQDPPEPSASQDPPEPSASQDPPEPSASQDPPEPSASQDPPEPSASQDPPEPASQDPPLSPVLPLSQVLPLSLLLLFSIGGLTWRVDILRRPRKRGLTMVGWGPRPAPEPPPWTDAHPDPPLDFVLVRPEFAP
ncbi:uncharacterized protein ACWYII_035825 [Salvelinus alpinus]